MAANEIGGLYKTKRDGGLVYTYHATWVETTDGVDWQATVLLAGENAGNPGAHIAGPVTADFAKKLGNVLVHYIEHRIGVR